ncbi:hypothetical protein [Corynebacterium flavescens]|uniref:hypothetical protein n=1 Tax=Corynebacterium flavescens TaxID=28028 RepID=UPI003FD46C99
MSDETYAAANLKTLRESKNLSRQNLIDEMKEHGLNLHSTSLRRIEEGIQPMKVNEASHFADYFGITLDQLVERPIDEKFAALQRDLNLLLDAYGDLEKALFDFVLQTKIARFSYGDEPSTKAEPAEDFELLFKLVAKGEQLIPRLEEIRLEIADGREPRSVDELLNDLGFDNGSR